ncbi:hypothetical protein WICPIJ_000285 [Wickerhamomyces pijperi]|uniref:Cell wall mannoprotein PIR1-like C-terminal domain-containing protein n=1 Tax=Wickerhamomyces pijperi TaxID=599730 RepID=A0A9P8TSV9_WICPI|nr:hypothetical protein WICPIJ_000285 [Wickerhamomyces pijperi]
MQYKSTVLTAAATLAGLSSAAYIPSEPWTTLTPAASAPSGAYTDYTTTFGIAVVPIATASASASSAVAKRDVISQIGDGQIQATTTTKSTATTTEATAQVISQIGDGQIQATTTTKAAATTTEATAQVISQIGDGQIQATTATRATAEVISQIGDGQIQATTTTRATAEVISQIGDGQIQATTSTAKTTATPVSQIGDGQIQASTTTADAVSQITDGQAQATSSATAVSDGFAVACKDSAALSLILKGGELTDAKGRIGSIVANRQFQFDGPPPQAGAIYAGGWSVTEDGYLALGNQTEFFQCLSGTFYNLYDESIGGQCHPINLQVVDLISC